MNGIEIFIDESGDFGAFEAHCPYYVVTMVFHETSDNLYDRLEDLEYSLDVLGLAEHCIHSNPAIRGEDEYYGLPLSLRRKVLLNLMAFVHNADFRFKCFFVKKCETDDEMALFAALKSVIDPFVSANFERLSGYSTIKVAYDKGQRQISRLITQTLEQRFDNVQVIKILPIHSRLSQVADLCCTIKRIAQRLDDVGSLNRPELFFFGSAKNFKRNWLKSLMRSEWR